MPCLTLMLVVDYMHLILLYYNVENNVYLLRTHFVHCWPCASKQILFSLLVFAVGAGVVYLKDCCNVLIFLQERTKKHSLVVVT